MKKLLLAMVLSGLMITPAAAIDFGFGFGNEDGYFGFWQKKSDNPYPHLNRRYRKKCARHWHGNYGHYHCIPRNRSWGRHKRYGH